MCYIHVYKLNFKHIANFSYSYQNNNPLIINYKLDKIFNLVFNYLSIINPYNHEIPRHLHLQHPTISL